MDSKFAPGLRNGLGFVLLATLAACNSDGSSSTGSAPTVQAHGVTPTSPITNPIKPVVAPEAPEAPTVPDSNEPPENTPPRIVGLTSGKVTVGKSFTFAPKATDDEGDTLRFTIAGKPAWTAFDPDTGRLSGTAQQSDIGSYAHIVISVSDGVETVALPEFNLTVSDAPVTVGARKSHPGHYVALFRRFDSQEIMHSSLNPGLAGFLKHYGWAQLEPTPGNYDFSEVESDLAWATAYGVRLIVEVEDKTFVQERPTPAYLDKYTFANIKNGYSVVRWDPYVVEREKALMQALGARFDGNPALEGIMPQEESAPGFDEATLDKTGYTPELYRDALIDVLNTTVEAFPTTRVFWLMNFLPRNQQYIANIAAAVAGKGVVMGGPDILPENKALTTRTYPFYSQFENDMPLFGLVSPPSYREVHGGTSRLWTPAEMAQYAKSDLHVSYLLWMRVTTAKSAQTYGWTDALPVIKTTQVGDSQ